LLHTHVALAVHTVISALPVQCTALFFFLLFPPPPASTLFPYTTLFIGIVGALAIVIMAMILGGDISMFVNVPSILIVIVGSMFAVMVKFELGQFLVAVKVAAKAFSFKISKPEKIIEEVVEMAGMARKGGLLSLEGREVSDEFPGKGIQLMVDGHDPNVARTLKNKDMKQPVERHAIGINIF